MTIQIENPTLIEQIKQIATSEKQTPEQVIAEAIRFYAAHAQKVPGISFLRSIAGQGASTETDVSQRDEEILASEIDPIRGWAVQRDNETAT